MQSETEGKASIRAAIERLGELSTAQAVAEFLTVQGITGRMGAASTCPVAVYVRRESDLPVVVGLGSWAVDKVDWDTIGGDLPNVVAEFVTLFDCGRFPRLITDVTQ